MLNVSIVPSRGNPNAPEFPFDGLFGLTDVTVRGKLAVKYDQRHPHPKPIELTSAVVRLVRIDVFNRLTMRDIVTEETVWVPPRGLVSSKMGEWERDFELVVPPTTPGLSRMGMMLGKVPGHSAATSWKLEATLTFPRDRPASAPPREVSLLRHSIPALASSPSHPLNWTSTLSSYPNLHPIPLEYDIRVANKPLGWNDSSEITFHLRAPSSATFCLKSLELVLSREVTLLYGSTSSTVVDDVPLDLFPMDDIPKVSLSPFHTPSGTPTEEVDRLLWRRSPSPPERTSNAVAKSSWPLSLSEGGEGSIEMKAHLKFRTRPSSNHRWSLGETGENKFIRINYTIRPRIYYKRSSGSFAPERHLDLERLPFRLAAVNVPERLNASLRVPLPVASTARSMGERRHSDFNLRLHLAAPISAVSHSEAEQPSPSPSALEDKPFKPSTGRRRSEQSDSLGQPARTRARTEEPVKVKRRPATATGIVPAFSVPDPSTMPKALSPSSTYDSLGPETPTNLEFLLTPAPSVTCDSPAPHVRSGSFPLANPIYRNHPSSSPRPPSTRSSRSNRQAYRPRSSGTLSIASTTSTVSSVADSARFNRDVSAPPATTSSSTILESSHELLGLSLSDPRTTHTSQACGLTIPALSSPSTSPDLSLDHSTFFPTSEPVHHFEAYSITPAPGSSPYSKMDRAAVAPWHSPPLGDYEGRPRVTSPLAESTSRSTFVGVSPPRLAREPSSASTFCPPTVQTRGMSPPSPPTSVPDHSTLSLPAAPTLSNRGRNSLSPESAALSNIQKRKGSVGGLLSLLTRRSSKV